MKPQPIATVALITLLLTVVWLVLMIAGALASGPFADLDHMILTVAHPHWSHNPGYINAAVLTIFAAAFYVLLFHHTQPLADQPSRLVALIFIPVYAVLNLVVYVSQVTLVPALMPLVLSSGGSAVGKALLAISVHAWPGSLAAVLNALAYAVLGIPSIIFGLALSKQGGLFRSGGFFLALNGFACILAIFGYVFAVPLLTNGSTAGGVLFLIALILLTLAFFRTSPTEDAA